MSNPKVQMEVLPHCVATPTRATDGANGYDLFAAKKRIIAPSARVLIPTGVALAVPPILTALIVPRSGVAYKYGVTVVNTPGTIDSDYRGEVMVAMVNHSEDWYRVESGDRVGQLLFLYTAYPDLLEVECLPRSGRDSGGFGSTGA